METKSVRCLINSISRFVHLVSCQTMKCLPVQKDTECVTRLMKHLMLLLDQVVDEKIANDNALLRECENLDTAINEAREFLETWCFKVGKLFLVWQMQLLLSKIRSSSLEICCVVCRLLQTLPLPSSLAFVESFMQELHCCKSDQISRYIEQAVSAENDNKVTLSPDQLTDVVNSLGLVSNRELLRESIAVEKQRMRVLANNLKADIDQINRVVDFLAMLRDHMMKNGYFDAAYGVQVPWYFRCPLSLVIMVDPVILASGQTFERASIQQWLNHGLTTCPHTHQPLSHVNIIPNYTIKALIANWFEQNNLKLPNNSLTSAESPRSHHSSQNVDRTDSFRCSLAGSNSPSGSSHEIADAHLRQKVAGNEPSVSSEEESTSLYQSKEVGKAGEDQSSPEHSYTHSRTQSISSAISSTDFIPTLTDIASISNKLEKVVVGRFSNEIRSECDNSSMANASLSGRGSYSYNSSKSSTSEVSESRACSYRSRTHSFPVRDVVSDEPTTSSHVEKLTAELKSHSTEVQSSAAAELRLLTKHSVENRVIIGRCGVVGPLISLLYSDSKKTQEHAVTALLNLSIHEENKTRIAEAGVIEPLIHVLRTGNDASKENSAATLFSISALEEQKVKIGRSEAIKALIHLLATGTLRGKKDAATALFNLSICHENKARIVQAGAVKPLVELLDDRDSGFADKAAALLANLSAVSEGRTAIAKAGGIPLIVELVESGSPRGKENAASVLLQLCLNNNKYCNMVLQEGAVPPLVALSQSGSARAREKAQQLLSHFRSQREGGTGKKKVKVNF